MDDGDVFGAEGFLFLFVEDRRLEQLLCDQRAKRPASGQTPMSYAMSFTASTAPMTPAPAR